MLSSLMQQFSIITNSPAETVHAAQRWFDGIKRNLSSAALLILFRGDLGAGKTQFVKGLGAAVGLEPDQLVSPSFTYVSEYLIPSGKLYHIDLWRAADPEVQAALNIQALLQIGNIVAVEWSEHLQLDLTGAENVQVFEVSITGEAEQREIQIQAVKTP
jgi:tRNA threonylcarbamoyladenosine biosynthesis protein TsaE